MPKLTPQEAREKYVRRTKNAVTDYKRGIQRVTESPGKKAVAQKDKMRQNLLEAIDSGHWERKTGAVTLEDWQKPSLEKGANNIAAGVDGAADKVEDYFTEQFQVLSSIQRDLQQMGTTTFQERMARAMYFAEAMHDWGEKRKQRG